ncbi:unnamed protein product [Ranitomeya imitator]|uniref:Uncharacterized protein n=1 Tax=Ranitomeya imitator TaxID=111125 RepID=A0ABN9MJX9_9NEOB|nr:unnamed protein product [Ranitomeya imitator]
MQYRTVQERGAIRQLPQPRHCSNPADLPGKSSVITVLSVVLHGTAGSTLPAHLYTSSTGIQCHSFSPVGDTVSPSVRRFRLIYGHSMRRGCGRRFHVTTDIISFHNLLLTLQKASGEKESMLICFPDVGCPMLTPPKHHKEGDLPLKLVRLLKSNKVPLKPGNEALNWKNKSVELEFSPGIESAKRFICRRYQVTAHRLHHQYLVTAHRLHHQYVVTAHHPHHQYLVTAHHPHHQYVVTAHHPHHQYLVTAHRLHHQYLPSSAVYPQRRWLEISEYLKMGAKSLNGHLPGSLMPGDLDYQAETIWHKEKLSSICMFRSLDFYGA